MRDGSRNVTVGNNVNVGRGRPLGSRNTRANSTANGSLIDFYGRIVFCGASYGRSRHKADKSRLGKSR